jgi:hypothetical protein
MNLKKSLFLVVMFLLPFMVVEANEQKSLELPRTQVIPILYVVRPYGTS